MYQNLHNYLNDLSLPFFFFEILFIHSAMAKADFFRLFFFLTMRSIYFTQMQWFMLNYSHKHILAYTPHRYCADRRWKYSYKLILQGCKEEERVC